MVSVDPVTATLPVAPLSVHSGEPACPSAVGQVRAAAVEELSRAVAGDGEVVTSGAWVVLAAAGLSSEPQAVRATASDAAQAVRATEEDTREKFTGVTLPGRDRDEDCDQEVGFVGEQPHIPGGQQQFGVRPAWLASWKN